MITYVADDILDSALKQPEAERARIAETLIASLDVTTDVTVDLAWQAEINQRLYELDSGQVKCIPWEEVRDKLHRNANVQC